MKTFLGIYSFAGLFVGVLWPLVLALYLGEVIVLFRRAWTHRKNRNSVRTIVTCGIIQIVAPIAGMAIARLIWRATDGVDPREAAIVSTTLLVMVAALVIGMMVGRKGTANHTPEFTVAKRAGNSV